MRKSILALAAGLGILATAAPAMAARPYGDRDHDGIANRYDRHDNRPAYGHRYGQRNFYRFADRNHDGHVSRQEYNWAQRHGGHGRRY